jgi:hypothetical protein
MRCGDDHEPRTLQIAGNEFAYCELEFAGPRPCHQLGMNVRRHQRQCSARAFQQSDFAQSHLAAADDQYALRLEIEKYWKIIHV